MIRLSSALLLMSLLTVSCSPAVPSLAHHLVLNKELAQWSQDVEKTLKTDRSSLAFSSGTSVSNCNAYFEVASKDQLAESVHNQLIKSEYLVCDALQLLSSSSPSLNIHGPSTDPGQALIARLDLRTFRSSAHAQANQQSHTLASMYPDATNANSRIAEVELDDWTLTFEVVAVARINANTIDDWIVWMADESKAGNYRAYQTLVLYDVENQGSLTGVPFPPPSSD